MKKIPYIPTNSHLENNDTPYEEREKIHIAVLTRTYHSRYERSQDYPTVGKPFVAYAFGFFGAVWQYFFNNKQESEAFLITDKYMPHCLN